MVVEHFRVFGENGTGHGNGTKTVDHVEIVQMPRPRRSQLLYREEEHDTLSPTVHSTEGGPAVVSGGVPTQCILRKNELPVISPRYRRCE